MDLNLDAINCLKVRVDCCSCQCYVLLITVAVRLVGGSSYNEGRVEVNYNGEWGTVCDDGWDDINADVVCRQLGFGSSGTAIASAGFGQGSGSILVGGVFCDGNELTLSGCGHLGINVTSHCSHAQDAGVRCSILQSMYIYKVSTIFSMHDSKHMSLFNRASYTAT